MRNKKALSLFLAVTMAVATISGCNKKTEQQSGQQSEQTESQGNAGETGVTTESSGSLLNGLSATKIGSIDEKNINITPGGIYYKDDSGKYGVMTLDGKNNTGAIYTHCTPVGKYFQVTTANAEDLTTVKSLNCMGLIDATGKEVIPMEYVSIRNINERYFKVIIITHETDNREEALVYSTDDDISFAAKDDDTFYKGSWYIYDIVAGDLVTKANGGTKYHIFGYGNILKYNNEKGQFIVNDKGNELPKGAVLIENGYYSLKEDKTVYICDSDNNKVLKYGLADFIPYKEDSGYFIARKSVGEIKYVIMDLAGNVLSAEFDGTPIICGDLAIVGQKAYRFDGTPVFENEIKRIHCDEVFGNSYLVNDGAKYMIIQKDGTILGECPVGEDSYADPGTFTMRNKVDGKNMYYSFKDKDFTLEGYDVGPWLVRVAGDNNTYNLVDTISGNTIISGYNRYVSADSGNHEVFVYATRADGGVDIYSVK